jgi:predicted nucleotidyltransferase
MRDRDRAAEIRDGDLREAIERLARAYEPRRIYLFGSAARGDVDESSDYDLMVVVPDSATTARRRSRIAYEALRGTRIAADVLVCTESYFDDRAHLAAALPGTILREGRQFYGE